MKLTYDHNKVAHEEQEVVFDPSFFPGFDKRILFRMWQVTPSGKTLVELGEILGLTGSAVSQMLDKNRMPVKYHTSLVNLGVPEGILPRPEDVKPGVKSKKKR